MIYQAGKTVRDNAVGVGLVVLFVPWVLDEEGIQSRQAADNDPVHCVSLVFRLQYIPIFLVMEVAEREDGYPSVGVMANTVDE